MTWSKLNLEQGMVRVKTLVVILIVVLLVIGGWVGYSKWQESVRNNPKTYSNKLVGLLADKNSDESYEMLSKAYKEVSNKEDWKGWVDVAFAKLTGDPVFVKEMPIEKAGDIYGKDTTPVRYVYSFTIGGKTHQVPFVFIKEDGTWKLAEIGSPIK